MPRLHEKTDVVQGKAEATRGVRKSLGDETGQDEIDANENRKSPRRHKKVSCQVIRCSDLSTNREGVNHRG
jgi:hypothetical protein